MQYRPTATNRAQTLAVGEPAVLWKHFGCLASIPRPSFKEQQVKEYLKGFCSEHHELSWREDQAGNLVIRHEGTGSSQAPAVMLQAHLDMVTEKAPGSTIDFDTDPITLAYDASSDWLTAEGSTLGADNGIGVAAACAILEKACTGKISVPPLEVLLTVAEEVGLVGAFGLNVEELGLQARRLINLDSEEWPHIYLVRAT
jgi:dipeptidase D